MKKHYEQIQAAINRAVDEERKLPHPILVFCSTADEGVYSGTVYPASYDGVVQIAATDQYGHMIPASDNGVDIRVPGENIEADGPSYMDEYSTSSVSGSSVATATAAGIASMALLMLKAYNWPKLGQAEEAEEMREFYTRDGILGVFDGMNAHTQGVQPSRLFSGDMKTLPELWNATNFKSRAKKVKERAQGFNM